MDDIWSRGRISPVGLINSEILLGQYLPPGSLPYSARKSVVLWVGLSKGTGFWEGFLHFFKKRNILK